jgi:hypothetical protein
MQSSSPTGKVSRREFSSAKPAKKFDRGGGRKAPLANAGRRAGGND